MEAPSRLPLPLVKGSSDRENAWLQSVLLGLRHEISLPLNALRLGIDELGADERLGIKSTQRCHLETMVTLCDDLMRLTHDYFDYANLVEGTPRLDFRTFTLKQLIESTRKEFAPAAAARQIGFRCRVAGQNATLHTDIARCEEVCRHLVGNALKFTPAGGNVCVLARSRRSEWDVCISDDGPGIPAEFRTQVFEPFFRLPRHVQMEVEGSGLGLAVCRELVDQLGGTIDILAADGPGTAVRVRLPKNGPTACRANAAATCPAEGALCHEPPASDASSPGQKPRRKPARATPRRSRHEDLAATADDKG